MPSVGDTGVGLLTTVPLAVYADTATCTAPHRGTPLATPPAAVHQQSRSATTPQWAAQKHAAGVGLNSSKHGAAPRNANCPLVFRVEDKESGVKGGRGLARADSVRPTLPHPLHDPQRTAGTRMPRRLKSNGGLVEFLPSGLGATGGGTWSCGKVAGGGGGVGGVRRGGG